MYDADTATSVDISLGFGLVLYDQIIRLWGINAPEMRGSNKVAGAAARDFARERVLGKNVSIQTIKDKRGKYGRLLGIIWYPDRNDPDYWVNLNRELVETGHAKIYMP